MKNQGAGEKNNSRKRKTEKKIVWTGGMGKKDEEK